MNPTRICLVGATGMIGSSVIAAAVDRPDLRIVGIARREVPLPPGARMEVLVAEPSGWSDAIAASGASVLVCALGTTIAAQGGDQQAFRAIDHDLVVECGRAAKAAGIGHMIVVSSVGADRASRTFYLRVKGETEDALAKLGLTRLDILRPGLLRGPRTERRPGERIAMVLSPLIDPFLRGGLRRFHSIKADVVAQAIFALAREKAGGRFVHDYDAMLRAVRRARG